MRTRYIHAGTVSPEWGVCAERALLDSLADGGPDTLLVYSRDRPAVSIGAYAKAEESLHLDFVERYGIAVIRRITGGSAIYTDGGQLTYCYVHGRTGESIEEGYARVCSYVALGLSSLGLEAVHKPINDIVSKLGKISGGAQYRDADRVLQHGSVIISLDRESMEKSLKPLKAPGAPMSSLEEALGTKPSKESVADAIASGFPGVGRGQLTKGELALLGKCLRSSSCSDL